MKGKSLLKNDVLGWIEIIEEKDGISNINFLREKNSVEKESTLTKECKKQLEEYFLGKRKEFNIKLDIVGTDFQKKCWNAISKIPYGKTISYSEEAEIIENKKAVRAVGLANGKNKIPIIIPCHRVIGKNGKLVGYSSGESREDGISIKKYLLELEKNYEDKLNIEIKEKNNLFKKKILEKLTVEGLKRIGKEKKVEMFPYLIDRFYKEHDINIKRELTSTICRYHVLLKEEVLKFIKNNVFKVKQMEIVYQMYRCILYNLDNEDYIYLGKKIEKYFNNEMIYKMKNYKLNRGKINKRKNLIKKAMLLEGNSEETLKKLEEGSINLIFTSPPYYNAKEYSNYYSYKNYLQEMKKILIECNRVLEEGRFICINISPVITKRPGREYESIRYPLHFDFHKILAESGFYFIDEIIWIKPEPSVPNRNGGYMQHKIPLTYKPNTITESILVYRKNSNFLLDENIKKYKGKNTETNKNYETSNCWYIAPSSSKIHPAVFPEELCDRIIEYYSFKNDVVMDPFAGIGTLGKAAIKLNRIPVLCEKKQSYIEYIKKEILNDDI